jgi:hypothetical protein
VVTFLCAGTITTGFCAACLVGGSRSSEEGVAVAAGLIERIGTQWSADALLDNAAPELLKATPEDKLRSFIAFVGKRLGPIKTCEPVQRGQWQTFAGTGGRAVFASYAQDCTFEHDRGRVTLRLVQRGHEWKVMSIHVNADALVKNP